MPVTPDANGSIPGEPLLESRRFHTGLEAGNAGQLESMP
jgi:hypothetical protein